MQNRDRILVGVGLTIVILLAWGWTLWTALVPSGGSMNGMDHTMMMPAAWSTEHAFLMLAMWIIMMVAMMLPSAAPFVLLTVSIRRRTGEQTLSAGALVAGGYLVVWGLFSVGATALQWGLESTGFLSAMSMRTGPILGGAMLLATGINQFTPFKKSCLRHCRTPMHFLTEHWLPGAWGAVRMGFAHGAYCVGCCWALMGLLFVGGIMNPFWIGGIAVYVALEKLSSRGEQIRQVSGALLITASLVIFAYATFASAS